MFCSVDADNTFGPQYCSHFDFTLLFEQAFFQILPCSLLICSFPLRALQLHQRQITTSRDRIRLVKLISLAVVATTQLALLIAWSALASFRTDASIPAAALSFLAALCLLYLTSLEHMKAIRPSAIIGLSMLVSLLCDIPQCRTLWLRSSPAVAAIFTLAMAAKTVVLYLESRTKRRSLLSPYRAYAPEVLVSVFDQTVLWWLNPLFFQGYRGLLSLNGLLSQDPALTSESNEERFSHNWKKSRSTGKRPLIRSLFLTLWPTIAAVAAVRLVVIGLMLSQPLLTLKITLWLENNDSYDSIAAGLIGATALLYFGLAIANATYQRIVDRLVTKIRGILISTGHRKTLSVLTDDDTGGAALTLLSMDTMRICSTIPSMASLVLAPLEIGGAIAILESQIGLSCIAPVVLVIALSGLGAANSKGGLWYQKQWLKSVQRRIAYTAAVLTCPKGFKMLGLTEILSQRIQTLRVHELAESAAYRRFVTLRSALGWAPGNLAPVVTLTVYALINGGEAITPSKAFTTLSLVALLSSPIHESIQNVPAALNALSSFDRIQLFLGREDEDSNVYDETSTSVRPRASEHSSVELSRLPISQTAETPSIVLQGATVCIDDGQRILTDVTFTVFPGTLVCIVGPVGSGKTTLLRAITGDIKLTEGRRLILTADEGFAYCAQDPWLPNNTVKNIIRGTTDFEEAWYTAVVQACALDSDIALFRDRDDTLVGSRGVSLSGGQRQRLALARALYSRKKVVVLDDVTAGLDADLSKQVLRNLHRWCHEHRLAVILATHVAHLLQFADHVMALGDGGKVISRGSPATLTSHDAYMRLEQDIDDSRADSRADDSLPKPISAHETDGAARSELARRTGDASVYKYYIASLGWQNASLLLITAICFAFGTEFPQLWVQWWTEAEHTGHPVRPLGLWIGIYAFLGFVPLASVFAHLWVYLVWTIPKSSADLHKRLLDSVMNAPYSFFVDTDAGVTLNRFSNDMTLIEDSLAGGVVNTLCSGGLSIGAAILICAGADYVGLAIPFIVVAVYAIQKFYLRTSRQLRYLDLEAQAPLLAHFQETIAGAATIRAFGWREESHQQCLDLLDRSQRPFYLLLCIQRWLNLVLDIITAAMATLLITLAVSMENTSSSSSVGLSLLNVLGFNSMLSSTIVAWTTLETSLGAVARCKNFVTSTSSEHLGSEIGEPAANWPSTGRLELSNLTAAYKSDRPVLQGLSVSIPAGAKVGIFGRSGSGKSSLLLTLFRMLDPTSGSILVDDVDLATVPRALIRQRFTALPQEMLNLPGSIRVNLDPVGAHDADEINIALGKVGLSDLVATRGGLDSEMTPSIWSQGELQLFAVARVLLRPSAIVVVDEMTSALDEQTEKRIMELFKTEMRSSTVIAVAHRLRTVMDFDLLIGMQDGKIVECGSPEQLLLKPGGYLKAALEHIG